MGGGRSEAETRRPRCVVRAASSTSPAAALLLLLLSLRRARAVRGMAATSQRRHSGANVPSAPPPRPIRAPSAHDRRTSPAHPPAHAARFPPTPWPLRSRRPPGPSRTRRSPRMCASATSSPRAVGGLPARACARAPRSALTRHAPASAGGTRRAHARGNRSGRRRGADEPGPARHGQNGAGAAACALRGTRHQRADGGRKTPPPGRGCEHRSRRPTARSSSPTTAPPS